MQSAGQRRPLTVPMDDRATMTRLIRARAYGFREEGGFTLAEMLVAIMITLIAFSSAMLVLNVAQRAQPRISDRSDSIQEGRVWIERLTRELRQGATMVGTPTASSMTFLTYVQHSACGSTASGSSIQCRVSYVCSSSGTCTRTERSPDGTGTAPAVQVVSGLQSNSVFTYSPTAAGAEYVGVTLQFPATDEAGETEDAITLQDGVSLRNFPG
jgi:prepilin-type N-terminal cleavage/methylation domain-containing protein